MDIPMCSIKKGTALCKVIQEGKAIVIDEALMTNRLAFEALDHTLKDLTGNSQPMRGVCYCVVILGSHPRWCQR